MSEFVAHVAELLEGFGPVRVRRMFGGHGLYRDDVMFALVADDVLYLKADEAMARELDALGARAFEYAKRGKTVRIGSFRSAPDELFDDPDAAAHWAARAHGAALVARAAARPRTRRGANRR